MYVAKVVLVLHVLQPNPPTGTHLKQLLKRVGRGGCTVPAWVGWWGPTWGLCLVYYSLRHKKNDVLGFKNCPKRMTFCLIWHVCMYM
jgi:hypothetical protein